MNDLDYDSFTVGVVDVKFITKKKLQSMSST